MVVDGSTGYRGKSHKRLVENPLPHARPLVSTEGVMRVGGVKSFSCFSRAADALPGRTLLDRSRPGTNKGLGPGGLGPEKHIANVVLKHISGELGMAALAR